VIPEEKKKEKKECEELKSNVIPEEREERRKQTIRINCIL